MKLKDPHTALHKLFLGAGNRHKEWLICISIVIETSDFKKKCILSFVQLQRTLKQTDKKKKIISILVNFILRKVKMSLVGVKINN